MSNVPAMDESALDLPLFKRGKVRDVYDLGDRLLLVATDRISAFDCVLNPGIPGKGIVLTQISNFWFKRFLNVPNHLTETEFDSFPDDIRKYEQLRGRSVIVRKCEVIPVECVARGYLAGSGLKDYQATGAVCGVGLPPGLVSASRLPEPIFTPASKAEAGHDENITLNLVEDLLGHELTERLRDVTLTIYNQAAAYALERGIIIADTKFEFGLADGELIWLDEALTPDSSRFWPADEYRAGSNPPSYDKQFVRDWLESTGWDKTPPAPELPKQVISGTLQKYLLAYETLTGETLKID